MSDASRELGAANLAGWFERTMLTDWASWARPDADDVGAMRVTHDGDTM